MEELERNPNESLLTAINPFALAEAISDKAISWGTDIDKQYSKLASTLGITVDEIFDADNPIIHPRAQLKKGEPVKKLLSESEAKANLMNFLNKKVINKPENLKRSAASMKRLDVAKAKAKRIADVLFPEKTEASDSGDWTHPDVKWKTKGTYYYNAPEGDDPIQGSLGDCYLIASLASIAWAMPYRILNRASLYLCDSVGDSEGNVAHQFDFYNKGSNSKKSPEKILEVSDAIPVFKLNERPVFASSYDAGETWPAVYEKGYAKYISGHEGDKPNYISLIGGNTYVALRQLTGGAVTVKYHNKTKASELLKFIQSNCGKFTTNDYWGKDGYSHRVKYPMTAEIWGNTEAAGYGLFARHAYSVFGFDYENGQYYVVLRNPHAASPATKDVKQGSWRVISNHFGFGSSLPLNVSDPSHKARWSGLFALKLETFARIFACTAAVKPYE